MKSPTPHRHHDIGLVAIAFIKLFYGVLLLALGIGALSLINRDLTALVTHWADVLEISSENQLLQQLVANAGLVRTNHLAWISALTFLYAALSFAMGIGLLQERRWAEYLTAIVSVSFIPVEIFELVRHIRATTIFVLAINAFIVIYLVWKLIRTRPRPRAKHGVSRK